MLHKGVEAFEAAVHHKIVKACSLNPALSVFTGTPIFPAKSLLNKNLLVLF